jgi:hypothetical protein
MKKTILIIAAVLCINLCTFAQGGLFQYGAVSDENYYGAGNRTNEGLLSLPTTHGGTEDVTAPLGSGALLLIGLGAAYAVKKQRKSHSHSSALRGTL